MIRVWQTLFLVTWLGGALLISACREKASTSSMPNATASPVTAAGGGAMTASSPIVLASPIDPTKPIPMPSGAASAMPNALNAIPEQMRRPLTLEEINKLPPETRDMILKAQGRAGAVTPAKK